MKVKFRYILPDSDACPHVSEVTLECLIDSHFPPILYCNTTNRKTLLTAGQSKWHTVFTVKTSYLLLLGRKAPSSPYNTYLWARDTRTLQNPFYLSIFSVFHLGSILALFHLRVPFIHLPPYSPFCHQPSLFHSSFVWKYIKHQEVFFVNETEACFVTMWPCDCRLLIMETKVEWQAVADVLNLYLIINLASVGLEAYFLLESYLI